MPTNDAPDFTLAHLEGRPVSLRDYRGKTVVLMFAARETGDQAAEIAKTIRSRYPSDEVPILSVLDMRGLPRMMRPVAKTMLKKVFKEAVSDETADLRRLNRPVPSDPSEIVVMLPDWEGEVGPRFGVASVEKDAVAVVVDGNGAVLGRGTGARAGDEILPLLGES